MAAFLPAALAILTGVALVVQPVVNGRLARIVGGTLWASGLSASCTALLAFALAAFFSGRPTFSLAAERGSWITWTGGVLGALALVGLTYAVPRIGAATVIVLVVTAQVVTALAVDQSGLLAAAAPVTSGRIAGALLVLAGATLFSLSGSR